MKKTSRILAVLLCMILCLGLMATAAFAAEAEQDGLKLVLSTDKTEYAADEQITVTLKVENMAVAAADNVNLKLRVPGGMTLVSGEASKSIASLAAGASETVEATYKVEAVPPMGDTGVFMVIALGVISCIALVMLLAGRKSACLALALLLVAGLAVMPVSANAASGNMEVSTKIKVDGREVTVHAVASYGDDDSAQYDIYKAYTFEAASDHGYSTFFFNENGVGPKGTAGLEKGSYRIHVTETTGTDWHIKFEKNIDTKPGSDYKLRYIFVSSVAGTVMLNGKAIEIHAGENTVENTILSVGGDTLYTELQLGMLPAPFTVDMKQVTVEEFTGSDVYTNVTPAGFRFNAAGQVYEQFNGGSEGSLTTAEKSATLKITKPGEANGGHGGVWESRMYIKTGMNLQAGKKYKISLDLEAASKYECMEVCFNSGDVEKGIGALYGQILEAGQKKTLSITVDLTEDKNDLIILLQVGQLTGSANTVTASNLVIEEITGVKNSVTKPYAFGPVEIGTFHEAGAGCEGYLYSQDSKLVLEMTKIGTVDWHSKMVIDNVKLEGGKSYTVRFTAKADKDLSCAFFLNGKGGWDPKISQTVRFTTTEQTYELKTDGALDAEGLYEILWQFGSEANSALGGAKIEFSQIQILAKDAN